MLQSFLHACLETWPHNSFARIYFQSNLLTSEYWSCVLLYSMYASTQFINIISITQKLIYTSNFKPAFIKDWNKSLVFAELWHMSRHGLFCFIVRGQDTDEDRNTVNLFLYLKTTRWMRIFNELGSFYFHGLTTPYCATASLLSRFHDHTPTHYPR
jgi:hypothetical protein